MQRLAVAALRLEEECEVWSSKRKYMILSNSNTYIGEDAVTLLTNAALQAKSQVVTADHDAAAEALLKRLHVWFDAWEVQPLLIRQEQGNKD